MKAIITLVNSSQVVSLPFGAPQLTALNSPLTQYYPAAKWDLVGVELKKLVDAGVITYICVTDEKVPAANEMATADVVATAVTQGTTQIARFASTANLNLATTALTVIDGVTPVAGDIALVKNQTTAAQNGLYIVSTGAWVAVTNPGAGSVLKAGMIVSVISGTVAAGKQYALGADLTTWSLVTVSGVSAVSLASNANGLGASLVGIEDAAGLITATTAEGALAELVKYQPVNLADPGTGVAIPVTRSAYVGIITAGAETNTLAIPTFIGQRLILNMDTRVGGDRVVTSAQAINQTGNTIMTFGAARDCIVLEAIKVGGAFRWTVTANDGVALS